MIRVVLQIVMSGVLAIAAAGAALAQSEPAAPEPFAVGTFEIDGAPTVGLVLRERFIVDLPAAYAAQGLGEAPDDMIDLIERYENGGRGELIAIETALIDSGALDGDDAPDYVVDLEDVRTLPPIMYPGKILNAALNFYSHLNESGTEEERQEAMARRAANRGIPYLFLKPSRGAVIGADDEIVLPYGRVEIDWEVELGAVIGRETSYVSAEDAEDHVFGYMVTLDISDRGGRPPGGLGGVDWFVMKGHRTFAPQGPWIVPKEFYGDPVELLRQTLAVDGEVMQEGMGGDMIHTTWELIEYASSIVTLYPGDVLNNGTSGGTGVGTAVRGEQRFLQDGEVIEAGIEGIGSMTLRVRREPGRPDGTGAQLPAIEDAD
ncbi:MAG: fumarylacetoacetate hydrolase family protein [Maricaulaceae bacterium]|jgi:2-keto-4-pentenoate hydratase/2-oxohepta-3-ene-1,7-dioic acid hydratase in catechol pathway